MRPRQFLGQMRGCLLGKRKKGRALLE